MKNIANFALGAFVDDGYCHGGQGCASYARSSAASRNEGGTEGHARYIATINCNVHIACRSAADTQSVLVAPEVEVERIFCQLADENTEFLSAHGLDYAAIKAAENQKILDSVQICCE